MKNETQPEPFGKDFVIGMLKQIPMPQRVVTANVLARVYESDAREIYGIVTRGLEAIGRNSLSEEFGGLKADLIKNPLGEVLFDSERISEANYHEVGERLCRLSRDFYKHMPEFRDFVVNRNKVERESRFPRADRYDPSGLDECLIACTDALLVIADKTPLRVVSEVVEPMMIPVQNGKIFFRKEMENWGRKFTESQFRKEYDRYCRNVARLLDVWEEKSQGRVLHGIIEKLARKIPKKYVGKAEEEGR